MAWIGGVFSDKVFHPDIFDTGDFQDDETMAPPDGRIALYAQAQREDEEILSFILTTIVSDLMK